MNKRQLEVERAKVKEEQKELRHLKGIYNKAMEDITGKIRLQDGKINVLMKDLDSLDEETKSILQSQIYQRKFQQSLKKQLDGYMSSLLAAEYKSIDDYMRKSYETGYVGNMYDLHGQNVPVLLPIDEKQVVRAMFTESKLSKRLYKKLGEDVELLKKRVANNLSRGVATSDSWANISRNIANDSKVGVNRAMRIARTEGHRIQCESAFDAMVKAKEKGADIVKQWDATLDGRTRKTHRLLHGQVREVDEPFEVKGKKVMHPGKFGRPEEDINCRCVAKSRVRSKMNKEELEKLKKDAEFFGLDKTKDFEDFRKRFLKAEKSLEKSGKSSTIKLPNVKVHKSVGAAAKKYEVRLMRGDNGKLKKDSEIIKVKAFAGAGTRTEIRERFELESIYGYPAEQWQKVRGEGIVIENGKERRVELHWYEADGDRVKMKVKRYLDES